MHLNLEHGFHNNTYWNQDFHNFYNNTHHLIFYSLNFSIAFLGVCFTVYGLYSMIKTDHFVPVCAMNLFICDLFQTSALLIETSVILTLSSPSSQLTVGESVPHILQFQNALEIIYYITVVVNICCMVIISADRYTMTAYPIWHKKITTIRRVYASVTVWITFTVLTVITQLFLHEHRFLFILLILILPYPLVIIFFVGTKKALKRNTTLPPKEQRRIMGTLALVLFIYTVLFLPFTITILHPCEKRSISWFYLTDVTVTVMRLNPLFDFLLYLVARKDAKDILSALCFCFRKTYLQNSATDTITEA